MPNQPSPAPTDKVTAALVAGALTTLVTWLLAQFAGIELPPTVQTAVTVVLMGAAAYMKTEGKGYVPRHRAGDEGAGLIGTVLLVVLVVVLLAVFTSLL